MQASRETELPNEHNVQNACDWIGNSVKVAMRHYLQTTEEDFERAVQPQKAKQNPKQYLHAEARKESHDENSNSRNSLLLRALATKCDFLRHREAPRKGLEQAQEPSGNPQFSNEAKQNPKQLAHEDHDLAELICAWPALHDAIKAGIVAIVRASGT